MSSHARFLHQLRHDLLHWRWRLGIYGALLLLSVPGLWLQQQYYGHISGSTWSRSFNDFASGLATLLAALALAGLLADNSPHDPEAFGHTRPARTGVRLASRLFIYAIGFLLPWMLQQGLLCHLAVGVVPWSDLWVRLCTSILPYASCFAFVVIIGSTPRQQAILIFATLILLFVTRIQNRYEGDGIFGLMPGYAGYLLNIPLQIWVQYHQWIYQLPQPAKVISGQLCLLGLGLGAAWAAWLWRKRVLPAALFGGAVILSSTLFKAAVSEEATFLNAAQEKALDLDQVTMQVIKPKVTLPARPGADWSFALQPAFSHLPPNCVVMAGLTDGFITTDEPARYPSYYRGLYSRYPADQEVTATQRLAPSFRRALLGAETENLSLSKKDSADEAFADHAMRPSPMMSCLAKPDDKRTTEQLAKIKASVQATLGLPITEYRIIARVPFRVGPVCHAVNGVDMHLTNIASQFKTVRTSAGPAQQWAGVEARFWYAKLRFDHHHSILWEGNSLGGALLVLLHNPARHEILGDFVSWQFGSSFAGTPISISSQLEHFELEENRLGSVDEHWLDGAELILVQAHYLGTLQRPLHLDGLPISAE